MLITVTEKKDVVTGCGAGESVRELQDRNRREGENICIKSMILCSWPGSQVSQ